jgi:hypothetical protein
VKAMNSDELKIFIKEQCGDPAIGIGDVCDLSSLQVEELKKTNAIRQNTLQYLMQKHLFCIPRRFWIMQNL